MNTFGSEGEACPPWISTCSRGKEEKEEEEEEEEEASFSVMT
jgi:hypothetical protein